MLLFIKRITRISNSQYDNDIEAQTGQIIPIHPKTLKIIHIKMLANIRKHKYLPTQW